MDSRRTMTRQYSEYSDFFSTQREREYDRDIDLSGQIYGVDKTGDTNRTLVWVARRTTGRGGQTTIGSIRTHSLRRWNSRRATNAEREVGQPSIGYQTRQLSAETVSGISHGSVPCLLLMGRIVRRLVVTFRRATQIGLRR